MDYLVVVNMKEPLKSRLLIMKFRYITLILLTLTLNSVYGQEARDFTITDTKGASWNLFDELAKGKTVVLDFFFADCTPCQKFTPALARLLNEYDQDSLLIIGISDRDNNAKVDEFEALYGVNYPSAGAEGGGDTITNLYRSWFSFVGWPTYAVVCPNRQIHWDLKRDTNFVELRQKIQECRGTLNTQTVYHYMLNTHPNPTSSNSTITLSLANDGAYSIKLMSSSGRTILKQESNSTNTLEIPQCDNGIYYLEILQENSIYQSKLVIQNN